MVVPDQGSFDVDSELLGHFLESSKLIMAYAWKL